MVRRRDDPETEDFRPQRRQDDEFRLSATGVSASGPNVPLILLIVLVAMMAAGAGYVLYLRNGNGAGTAAKEHADLLDALEIQAYILSECLKPKPNDCHAIQLRRPKGLNERLAPPAPMSYPERR